MYRENVKADVIEAVRENYTAAEIAEKINEDRDAWIEDLNEELWIDDGVTGNASGSYFCNSYKAKEAVMEDTGTVMEALREFCVSAEEIGEHFINEDWEYLDVTARCYVLYEAIDAALDDLEDEDDIREALEKLEADEDEDEDEATA